jgi:hypothetical protein
VTFLVRSKAAGQEKRTLITLPRSDVKEITITSYDPILPVLFPERANQTRPQLESGKGECQ